MAVEDPYDLPEDPFATAEATEKSDFEKLHEIIEVLESAIVLQAQLFEGIRPETQAKLDLYKALYVRVESIFDTVGTATIAQSVARENIAGLEAAIRLAETQGLV
jgi:hypothetical protein